jgi:F-box domain
MSQPTSQFCALSIELIEYIAAELELTDLCLLRLVCKNLSYKTLHYFGSTYFVFVRTDLSRASIQKLKQLSRHDQLGHYVRVLLIKGPHGIGRGFFWDRSPSHSLIFPHPGVQTLQDALLNLDNCRSFYLYNDGSPDKPYERGCLWPSDVVAIVLHIIAETGLPVRSFAADFFAFGEWSVDIDRLHLASYQKVLFRSGWSQLRELSLRQRVLPKEFDWVQDLLLSAPNLRCLTFNFGSEVWNSFFDWVAPCERLPKLQELNISSINFHSDSLFEFLFRFGDSLRILRLTHFSLDCTRTWKSTFKLLRTKLPVLETIAVYFLQEWIWMERNGIRRQVKEIVVFPRFLGLPSVPGLENPKPCWLDGWKVVDNTEIDRYGDCFPGLSKHPSVSEPKYTNFIVTGDNWGIQKKGRVLGVGYSGANMGDVLDMLAESTTPMWQRQ